MTQGTDLMVTQESVQLPPSNAKLNQYQAGVPPRSGQVQMADQIHQITMPYQDVGLKRQASNNEL